MLTIISLYFLWVVMAMHALIHRPCMCQRFQGLRGGVSREPGDVCVCVCVCVCFTGAPRRVSGNTIQNSQTPVQFCWLLWRPQACQPAAR